VLHLLLLLVCVLQIFINGEFMGGLDVLLHMHYERELGHMLEPIKEKQQKAAKA
jgi:hypothetical protein